MKRKELISALAVAVVIAGALLAWFGPWGGSSAPNVELTMLDGRTASMASYEGKPVLLQFWATTCVTCVKEIPQLKALHKALGPSGLELIGVAMSYDPPQQVASMAAEKSLPYPIALDRDGSIAKAFGGVRLTPTTVLINAQGKVVWRRLGELDFASVEDQIRGMLKG